jgi:hypothetical protein
MTLKELKLKIIKDSTISPNVVYKHFNTIESGSIIIGATAVEDKLQDGYNK